MTNHFTPLWEDTVFHVYNRGNDKTLLFYEQENYEYFLGKLQQYIEPYAVVLVYCLLPNHFHLLIRIRNFSTLPIERRILRRGKKVLHDPETIVSEQFKRMFNGYAKAIRKRYGGHGSLFQKRFKRKKVLSDSYLRSLVNYIHRNPQTHGLIEDFTLYPHSSYQHILTAPLHADRHQVIRWFGDAQDFACFHSDHPVSKETKLDRQLMIA